MDKIKKALNRLSSKERRQVKNILEKLYKNETKNFDIKKLKGRNDIFRIRKGKIRIIYRLDLNEKIFILTIEKRNETTYKF
ncbi:hypothetical protein KKA15_01545 [Patescibacteria group bacterium]|nr:hypothetical protein [Patescibacteria group bacterium]